MASSDGRLRKALNRERKAAGPGQRRPSRPAERGAAPSAPQAGDDGAATGADKRPTPQAAPEPTASGSKDALRREVVPAGGGPAEPTGSPEEGAGQSSDGAQDISGKLDDLSRSLEDDRKTMQDVAGKFEGMEERMKNLQYLSELLSVRYNPFLQGAEDRIFDGRDPTPDELVPGLGGMARSFGAPQQEGGGGRSGPGHGAEGDHKAQAGRPEDGAGGRSPGAEDEKGSTSALASEHREPPSQGTADTHPQDGPHLWETHISPDGGGADASDRTLPGTAAGEAGPASPATLQPDLKAPGGSGAGADAPGAAPDAPAHTATAVKAAPAYGARQAYLAHLWFDALSKDCDPAAIYLFLDHYRDVGWIDPAAHAWLESMAAGVAERRPGAEWNTFRIEPRRLLHLHKATLRFLDLLFRTHLQQPEAEQLERAARKLLEEN